MRMGAELQVVGKSEGSKDSQTGRPRTTKPGSSGNAAIDTPATRTGLFLAYSENAAV